MKYAAYRPIVAGLVFLGAACGNTPAAKEGRIASGLCAARGFDRDHERDDG